MYTILLENNRERIHGTVSFDSTLRTCSAIGSEEYIVNIAQQVSWLAAACQEKLTRLSYAFVRFTEAEIRPLTHAAFKVGVKLHPIPIESSFSCWKTLLGPGIIIFGFPIPPRNIEQRGLEISVPAMSAMARIPQAVSFEGGFIFKGRCHALIPIRLIGQSVQWHMLDAYPDDLDWARIRKQCPSRLKGHAKSYSKHRSFVGWCPDVLEYIGT